MPEGEKSDLPKHCNEAYIGHHITEIVKALTDVAQDVQCLSQYNDGLKCELNELAAVKHETELLKLENEKLKCQFETFKKMKKTVEDMFEDSQLMNCDTFFCPPPGNPCENLENLKDIVMKIKCEMPGKDIYKNTCVTGCPDDSYLKRGEQIKCCKENCECSEYPATCRAKCLFPEPCKTDYYNNQWCCKRNDKTIDITKQKAFIEPIDMAEVNFAKGNRYFPQLEGQSTTFSENLGGCRPKAVNENPSKLLDLRKYLDAPYTGKRNNQQDKSSKNSSHSRNYKDINIEENLSKLAKCAETLKKATNK